MLNDFPALFGYGALAVWIFTLNIEPVNSFFMFSGKISFALYLLHYMVLYTALSFRHTVAETLILVAALMTTYALAVYYNKATGHLYKFFNVSA